MKSIISQKKEIKSLTSLRGIAALMVMFFHFRVLMYPSELMHDNFPNIINNGFLFVDFFFILSGFIMFYVYENFFNSNNDIIKYFCGRAARLLPAMIICVIIWLIINIIVYLNEGDSIFLEYGFIKIIVTIVVNLLFLQEWILGYNLITGPSWSVSIEVFFYLIFPFVYIRLFKIIGNNFFLLSFVGFLSCVLILYIVSQSDENFNYFGLPRVQAHHVLQCLGSFTLGACLYHTKKFINLRSEFILSFFQIILLFMILYLFHISRAGSLNVILMGFFIFLVSNDKGIVAKILTNNFLILLGNLSYGIYLFHTIIQIFAEKSGFFYLDPILGNYFITNYGLFKFITLSIITVIFSYFAYFFVEIRLRNFLIFITNARK